MTPSIEGGSGSSTPALSTTSTAVENQTNGLLLPSPQKSLLLNGDTQASLAVRRASSSRSRERRSFSSTQKLPVLTPSSSRLRRRIDLLVLWALQTVVSVYLSVLAVKHQLVNTVWELWYNWHAWIWWGQWMIRMDVDKLHKVPRHLAVILDERRARRAYDADETVRRVAELAAWCACSGIRILTIYEPTGLLKKDVKRIQNAARKSTTTYLHNSAPGHIDVRTPQSALLTNGSIPDVRDMEILVISQEDSRLPIVDLARTLGDMTKQGKFFSEEITIDLVHEELTENLMTEPDLLILFSPLVDLQGFPPWQIRLTEIFHLPDNHNFNYSVFIRALQEYDRAEFRIGR